MIEPRLYSRGGYTGKLALIIPASGDYIPKALSAAEYMVNMDAPDVLVVLGVPVDEPFSEPRCRNEAVKAVDTEYLAFSCAGVYPPATLVSNTIAELEADPNAVIVAQRIDGTESGGFDENKFALGDWQCMSRQTFEELGGFDERLHNAGYIEFDLLTRAYLSGRRIVLMDDCVIHAYHPKPDGKAYRELLCTNKNRSASKGLPIMHWKYPNIFMLEYSDGIRPVAVSRQKNSIHTAFPHQHAVWSFSERDYPLIPGTSEGMSSQVINRYSDAFDLVRGRTVLDWGCGTGYGTFLLSKYAKEASGYDVSEDAITWAREYKSPNLRFHCSPPDAQFDVVTCIECIEHVHDPRAMMAQLAKRTVNTLYITTPITDGGPQRNPYHLHSFTRESFYGLLSEFFSDIRWLPDIQIGGANTMIAVCSGRKEDEINSLLHSQK